MQVDGPICWGLLPIPHMKAIRIDTNGGPEVMSYVDLDTPAPGASQILVKISAAGVNYIDVYHRTGLYPVKLPYTLGLEGAGIVEQVGDGVEHFSEGERVAFTSTPGAYAEYVSVPEKRLVHVPDDMELNEGAAIMLQGCTAHYLSHDTYPLKPGVCCLVHAAAGGVGLLLIQMAKLAGARVFGTVSTKEKAELARQAGADEVIFYTKDDFEKEVQRLTEGIGVDVVYDSVGHSTFDKSLNCLKRLGTLVLFGQSSGPVEGFAPETLARKGSLYMTRPTLLDYIPDRESLQLRADELFKWFSRKELKLRIEHTFSLSDAQEAHRSIEGRRTTGKVLLIP